MADIRMCDCLLPKGCPHPSGWSDEFGGEIVIRDVGFDGAHATALLHEAGGYEARVYVEPGFGWFVQARKVRDVGPRVSTHVEREEAMIRRLDRGEVTK